jgi:hypothetical protein
MSLTNERLSACLLFGSVTHTFTYVRMSDNKQDKPVVVACEAVRQAFLPLVERIWFPLVHHIRFRLSNYDPNIWPLGRDEAEQQMRELVRAQVTQGTPQPEYGWTISVVLDELYTGRPVCGVLLVLHNEPPSSIVQR